MRRTSKSTWVSWNVVSIGYTASFAVRRMVLPGWLIFAVRTRGVKYTPEGLVGARATMPSRQRNGQMTLKAGDNWLSRSWLRNWHGFTPAKPVAPKPASTPPLQAPNLSFRGSCQHQDLRDAGMIGVAEMHSGPPMVPSCAGGGGMPPRLPDLLLSRPRRWWPGRACRESGPPQGAALPACRPPTGHGRHSPRRRPVSPPCARRWWP